MSDPGDAWFKADHEEHLRKQALRNRIAELEVELADKYDSLATLREALDAVTKERDKYMQSMQVEILAKLKVQEQLSTIQAREQRLICALVEIRDIAWREGCDDVAGVTLNALSFSQDASALNGLIKEKNEILARELRLREALLRIKEAYGANITDTVGLMRLLAKNALEAFNE
jgi:hypothetical protein